MPELPSLLALRAFDASSRHLSFTKAAHELHLTQSAVSRHIRKLEKHLGVTLFTRGYREIALTKRGEAYQQDICAVFRQIERATGRILHSRQKRELSIHAHTYVATAWLVSRLKRFNDRNPDIEFSLSASSGTDALREQPHGAIRAGTGEFALADKMFDVNLIPVCAPALARRLRSTTDLERTTLLHTLGSPSNWPMWLAGVGEARVDPSRGFRFESSVMACEAARNGLGVAIAYEVLCRSDIESGRLVTPFPTAVPANRAYYFLRYPQYEGFEPLRKFRAWLLSECGRSSP